MATTVVVAAPATGSHPGEQFKEEFKKIGISDLSFGGASIVLEIIALAIWIGSYRLTTSAPGIYCGIWFCVCGGLALASSRQPSSCNIIAGLIISIFALFGCVGMIYYESYLVYLIAASWGFHFLIILHILLDFCAIGMLVTVCIYFKYAARSN